MSYKERNSCKTSLSSYYACLSRDLLLMASGADTHTHMQTYRRSRMKRFKETRCTWPSAMRGWFNMIGTSHEHKIDNTLQHFLKILHHQVKLEVDCIICCV